MNIPRRGPTCSLPHARTNECKQRTSRRYQNGSRLSSLMRQWAARFELCAQDCGTWANAGFLAEAVTIIASVQI